MKEYLINMHLLVTRSTSSAKVKVKYKGYISQKMAILGAFMFHKHILFVNISEGVDVNVTPDKRQVFMEGEKILLATVKVKQFFHFNHQVTMSKIK